MYYVSTPIWQIMLDIMVVIFVDNFEHFFKAKLSACHRFFCFNGGNTFEWICWSISFYIIKFFQLEKQIAQIWYFRFISSFLNCIPILNEIWFVFLIFNFISDSIDFYKNAVAWIIYFFFHYLTFFISINEKIKQLSSNTYFPFWQMEKYNFWAFLHISAFYLHFH